MSIESKRRLILHLDSLIRRKTKGSSKELAGMLGIHESTFFRLLIYMREELEAPVVYDASIRAYIYKEEGRIYLGFVHKSSDLF